MFGLLRRVLLLEKLYHHITSVWTKGVGQMMLQMVDFTYSTDFFLVADQRPYTWKNLHFTKIPHLQTLPQVKKEAA